MGKELGRRAGVTDGATTRRGGNWRVLYLTLSGTGPDSQHLTVLLGGLSSLILRAHSGVLSGKHMLHLLYLSGPLLAHQGPPGPLLRSGILSLVLCPRGQPGREKQPLHQRVYLGTEKQSSESPCPNKETQTALSAPWRPGTLLLRPGLHWLSVGEAASIVSHSPAVPPTLPQQQSSLAGDRHPEEKAEACGSGAWTPRC